MFEMCRMLLSPLARLRLHPGTTFLLLKPPHYVFQKLSGEAEISSLLFQILLMKRLLKRFFPGERENLTSFGGKLFRASHSCAIERKIRQARKLFKQEFRQVVCHPDWSNCSELSFKVTRAFKIQFVIYCSPPPTTHADFMAYSSFITSHVHFMFRWIKTLLKFIQNHTFFRWSESALRRCRKSAFYVCSAGCNDYREAETGFTFFRIKHENLVGAHSRFIIDVIINVILFLSWMRQKTKFWRKKISIHKFVYFRINCLSQIYLILQIDAFVRPFYGSSRPKLCVYTLWIHKECYREVFGLMFS